MGTADDSSAEWVEFFNTTDETINLNGFVLETENGLVFNLSGDIFPEGYHVLDTLGLSDLGDVLTLKYNEATIDKTPPLTWDFKRWAAGNTAAYMTMEKYAPDLPGEDKNSWGSNLIKIRNGRDADGKPLNGTPGARNSLTYLIERGATDISNSVTLTKKYSPYYVPVRQDFSAGTVFTIEPGVIIKFDPGTFFNIFGKIIAEGTEAEPIVFTSYYDDEYGGDTDGEENAATVVFPGLWDGIVINDTADDDSVFTHAMFRYSAGFSPGGQPRQQATLSVLGPDIHISTSLFEYSKGNALKIVGGNVEIKNCVFKNDIPDMAFSKNEVFLDSVSGEISGNTFSGGANGLYLNLSQNLSIRDNVFSQNNGTSLVSFGPLPVFENNSGSGGKLTAIKIGGTLTVSGNEYFLKANPLPYYLNSGSYETPTVASSSALTLGKGVVIKGSGSRLDVYGRLVVAGENPEDVVFTSLSDDSIGGDTESDGDASRPGAGMGVSVAVRETGSLNARGFTMRYGGNTIAPAMSIEGSSAVIADAVFDANFPNSLVVRNSSDIKISNTRFENHKSDDPMRQYTVAVSVANSAMSLSNVVFKNNPIGLRCDDMVSTFIADTVTFLENLWNTIPDALF